MTHTSAKFTAKLLAGSRGALPRRGLRADSEWDFPKPGQKSLEMMWRLD